MPNISDTIDSPGAAIDYPRLMIKLDGDRELFKELVELFMQEHPGWLAELRRCIDAGSAADLVKIAHLLRGVAGHFGAHRVAPLAMLLENLGRSGALVEAEQQFLPLQESLEQLRVSLQFFADDRNL